MPGTLYVVATPIGNLEDLTFRALRILREADLIAAEDTRRTSKLLAHYQVSRPLVSLHEHNEYRVSPKLVERMAQGESIALVTDAGTPGISDPGATLVALTRRSGLPVIPIPGPSAVVAALSVSGLQASEFTFLGFPPSSGSSRTEWLARLREESRVCVFFESPLRVRRTVAEISSWSKRGIFIFKELTKIHESFIEWPMSTERSGNEDLMATPSDLVVSDSDAGEFVVVVDSMEAEGGQCFDPVLAELIIGSLTEVGSLSESQILDGAAAILGSKPSRIKNAVKKARIERKRLDERRP